MKKIVILLFFTISLFAQDLTKWQNYFSYNNVVKISGSSSELWAASDGGAFVYNASDDAFRTFSIIEGLGSNITAVAKDQNGKIWLGNSEGMLFVLNSENGEIDKIYDIVNSDKTLKGINSIKIVGETAYIASDFGVSLVDINTYNFGDTYRKFGDFNVEIKTYDVLINNDKIYVSTKEGIAILKDNSTNPVAPESWNSYAINGNNVYKTIIVNSELFIGSNNGVYKFDGSDWNQLLLPGKEIKDLEENNGNLFILTQNKLYNYNNSLSEINTNINVDFQDLIVETQSSFLIASDSGVVKINNGTSILMPEGPLKNRFYHIDTDESGDVFAATGIDGTGQGIYHLDKTIWRNYNLSDPDFIGSNDAQRIYCAEDGKTFFLTKGNGITIYEDGELTNYNATNSPLQGISVNPNFVVVSDLEYDQYKNAWMTVLLPYGKKNIVVRREPGDWYAFELPSNIAPNPVEASDIEIDRYDTKWFISNQRLCYFNNAGNYVTTADDTWGILSSVKNVKCIEIDEKGELWVGTSSGLYIVSQTNNYSLASVKRVLVEAVYGKSIEAIEVDALNQKWVVSEAGLVLLSHDGTSTLDVLTETNSPLPSLDISSLAFEKNTGLLYIAADGFLMSYQTTAQQPVDEFEELFVYPSPFVINSSSSNYVSIDGLIKDSYIKILTISGELIKEFETPGGRVATWDGKDENGQFVGSGVYVVIAYDREANNVATTKIAVLRK